MTRCILETIDSNGYYKPIKSISWAEYYRIFKNGGRPLTFCQKVYVFINEVLSRVVNE